MNYDKLFEEFITEVKKEGTYATTEELKEVTKKMLDIIIKHKDHTPEELVEKIIEDNIGQIEEIKSKYPIPGYTIGINVANINVKLFGGDIDSLGRELPDDALFDIASMTKFYTQVISYNLIKEGILSLDNKIKDLDSRFKNVNDLTVEDVLSFTTTFKTNGRLSEKQQIDEALDCLYNMEVVEKGAYNYNDMGMMLMKEVLEKVTGISYDKLVEKYITNKLSLTDTHLIVPKNKIQKLTGSANASKGAVNDPSALSVGGYSGHAGIFASSDDLIKLGKGIFHDNIIPKDMLAHTYTRGAKENRGVMGNTYVPHPKGIDMSFVDILEPTTNFAIQGSTRVQMNIGKQSVSTILLNPASMSIDRAIEEQTKINNKRLADDKPPLALVKHFTFNRDGKFIEYDLIDARQMVPASKSVEPITTSNAILALRLRFLNKVIEAYDKNYKNVINISKRI